jgi:hypothetical protein
LGWLDTPTPRWLFIATLIAWAVFLGYLYARNRIPTPVVLLGVAGVFILPSILEALRWNDYPQWLQGRHTLPFVAAFLYLVLIRYARVIPRAVRYFSLLATAALAVMVWLNGVRYAFGIRDSWPLNWQDPAIGPLLFVLTMISAGVIVIVGITRAIMFASPDRKIRTSTQRST